MVGTCVYCGVKKKRREQSAVKAEHITSKYTSDAVFICYFCR